MATPSLGLIRFAPRLVEKVWGGRRLEAVFGRALPPGSPTGESWEISGLREALTYVASGPLKGADLYRLAATHGKAIFGAALGEECRTEFPLLVKFIDASDVLSVQVHPGDEAARAAGFAYGKSEAWVIVAADPGACVYRGFAPGVGKKKFRAALAAGDVAAVERRLNRVAVAPGDVVDLPAGVVHAIGAGVLLCEVQQSSDLTYRVYDWGRVGLDGKPRALHIEAAFGVMSFKRSGGDTLAGANAASGGLERTVYRDAYPFHLEVAAASAAVRVVPPADRFEIVCVLEGRGEFVSPSGEACGLGAGDCAMVPAVTDAYTVRPAGAMKWVRSWVVS